MRANLILGVLLLGLMAGCGGQASTKPVEVLDERTGVTVGALKEPIELVAGAQISALGSDRRTSFAYLGPVEWNRSGAISYGLWVHIAPANGGQPGDIHAPAAVTLILDDGPLDLSPIDAPKLGLDPYKPVVSWGQTAYYDLTIEALRRMAASGKFELDVRAADGSTLSFAPTVDIRTTLNQYMQARGITRD
jgi:hypothetical protein